MVGVSEEKPDEGLNLQQYVDVIRRRHMYFLIPFFLGWLAVWSASWVLPSRYRSSTLILVEQASMKALAGRLPPDKTSVGYEVQLAHLSPTPVGSEVTAEATLEGVEGRRLTFRVSVTDARGLVAAGRITRVVVVRDRFVERAQSEL